MQDLELLSWDLILALAGRYWNLQTCPAVLRATKKKIRSPCTPGVNMMPRVQHASISERSRQRNNHLPQLGGSWGCGLSLPAAGLRSGVWSQSHPTNLFPSLMPLGKSLILNKTSLLSFGRICPAALWPRKCLQKRGARGMGRRSCRWGSPIFSVLLLPAVSNLIIFFSWTFQGCCSCLAGNFSCSSAASHCCRSLLTQHGSQGPREEWPPSPYQQGDVQVEGPPWHRSEGQGNYLRLQFLQVMPGHSCISGKQEAALPEQRTLLSATSTLKPSSVLIWDKFY